MKFMPTWYCNSIYDLDLSVLKENNVKYILTDLDNTLAPYNIATPNYETIALISKLKSDGFNVIIVSNNTGKRVKLSEFERLSRARKGVLLIRDVKTNPYYVLTTFIVPLHNLYFVYLFGYMASMVSVLIYSMAKKKLTSKMHASFLCVIVFGNILVWLIEQFIEHNFEFLCVSYILNECLLLFLYGMLREYEYIKTKNMKENVVSVEVDMKVLETQEKLTEEQVAIVFTKWKKVEELTKREKEIVKHLLLGDKRKDIAQKLFLSDSAVRNHITRIFKKLEVENTNDLCKKAKKKI